MSNAVQVNKARMFDNGQFFKRHDLPKAWVDWDKTNIAKVCKSCKCYVTIDQKGNYHGNMGILCLPDETEK